MNIGSLYTVKKYFWVLFPSKETTSKALGRSLSLNCALSDVVDVRNVAAWYSELFNCEVTYFSPKTLVVFLEEDGRYKKVLTSDGRIGWIWFSESYNNCFEEVKANP